MRKRMIQMGLAIIAAAALLSGCQKKQSAKIVIGGTAISQAYYDAIKESFEAKGYETEFKSFDSNVVVLEACASGEVDMALGQHKRFVYSFNENNQADLEMAKPYAMYTGIGLYSETYSAVSELPEGARIAVMNDAMNEDIALRILEQEGLITIAADRAQATTADIIDNPQKLEIIEMDQAQTVTALDDLDAACVFFTHMAAAGKDVSSYIARDHSMINYPMGVIVKQENKTADWAVAFAECFKTETVQAEIEQAFPGVFEFYQSDDQVQE